MTAATLPLLETWLNAQHQALLEVIPEAFRRMGAVVVPTLQIAQNDPRPEIQRAAAYMLTQVGAS